MKDKNELFIETYSSNLLLFEKITFITNFIYKNMNTNKLDYNIEEFESDYEEFSDEEIMNESDFDSE